MLKKPLGKLVPFESALSIVRGKKVIAIGDEVVFNFLEAGVVPFVSVFDFRTLRAPVRGAVEKRISGEYPAPMRMEKEAGELSMEMFVAARSLLKRGGALLVMGEEDLFALPFAMIIEDEAVVYGQPGEGCVVVSKDNFGGREKLEKEVKKMGLVLPHRD
ncbi:DUF359 domain-containing protein [Candidatus Micrarchaeota archaeon]|nr:DUF359 domain-containing protein [Candidatus Micrarchaeota archaeon]